MMNFNEHQEIKNRFLGSDKKKTFLINGERYLIKFPDPVREKGHDLSYINNAFSEYIGCKVYESIGIPTQEVVLGTYTEDSGKTKIACGCKDFCNDGYELYEAEALMLSMTDEEPIHRTELSSILRLIDRQGDISPALKNRFYDMFVVDYLINNPDRHNGNWGILSNPFSGGTKVAPIYDCGSCLMPLLDDSELSREGAKNAVINMRSAILNNGKRIFCSAYLKSRENEDLNEAVKRIYPRIDMNRINGIIDRTPYLSEERKAYYKTSIGMARDLVLSPTYRLLTKEHFMFQSSSVAKEKNDERVKARKEKDVDIDL